MVGQGGLVEGVKKIVKGAYIGMVVKGADKASGRLVEGAEKLVEGVQKGSAQN